MHKNFGLEFWTMERRILLVVAVILGLASIVVAIPGTATYFTSGGPPPACYTIPEEGTMIAAASDVIWENGAACGRKYSVTCTGTNNQGVPQPCTGASVVVTIVDYCPACPVTFDLSQEAFATIADLNAGKINIDYTQV